MRPNRGILFCENSLCGSVTASSFFSRLSACFCGFS
jgi:hypothetical protein